MKYLTRLAVLAAAVAALLVPAASATAAPSPGFGEFTGCASKSVDPDVTLCFRSVIDEGFIKLGSKTTPIVDPITLVAGLEPDEATGGKMVNPVFDGGRQIVPGGIVGITGLEYLHWLFPFSLLQLYAETELAGTPGNPLNVFFPLPIKVKLESAMLSNTCYIGSNANPIALNLNTEVPGDVHPDPNNPAIFRITNQTLADHSFSVPAASGCGFLGLGVIDALVNSQSGLPSPSGNNDTVQIADGALSPIQAVYQPAGFEQ